MDQYLPFSTNDPQPARIAPEQFVMDLLANGEIEMLARIALTCISVALASGTLELETLVAHALNCTINRDVLMDHFLEVLDDTRAGSLRFPAA